MLIETFRALADRARARGIISPELFQAASEVSFVDESYSIIGVRELHRTYSRRLRRLDEDSPYFGEIRRLLDVLSEVEARCEQVRFISVWISGGRQVLALIDPEGVELLYMSAMWISYH